MLAKILLLALALSWLAPRASLAAGLALPAPEDAAEPAVSNHARHDSIRYCVVTTRALRPEFLRLARAHTRDGLRAAVWTLESIRDGYPDGRDDAERIRFFLQQAYRDRGARWLLLGGSDRVIPMRRATISSPFAPPPNTLALATDQYYACLDGTWNADGDSLWGEDDVDDTDFVPELIVGRAPVSTRREAERFVDRTIAALDARGWDERADDAALRRRPTGKSVLLIASEIGINLVDGAIMTERLRPYLETTPSTHVARLYENASAWPGSWPLTEASGLDSLDRGYDLVVLCGPGAPGIFATHSGLDGTAGLTPANLSTLTNRNRGIFYFLSASTCSPDTVPSVGEALINAPRGGATAVLGTTDNQGVGAAGSIMMSVLTSGAPTIGEELFAMLRERSYPGSIRLSTQGLVLFGDPALPMRVPIVAPAPALLANALPVAAADAPASLATSVAAPTGPRMAPLTPATALATGARSLGAPPAELALAITSPEPARTSMRMQLAIPPSLDGADVEVAAYDVVGRRLRTLERGTARTGRRELVWNLDDATGAPVRMGVYFIGARVGSRLVPQRVVVVR